ncbi:hypothetical protein PFISCL1PPCAC_22228, partial [Pristionchus fissidentatus]
VIFFTFAASFAFTSPTQPRFACQVQNHYTDLAYVACETQCYSINVLTNSGMRTIRRGCAGSDDLIERAKFELEHKIALIPTDCRTAGSGTLRMDGEMTLTQKCCSTPFCNSSSGNTLLVSIALSLIALLL